MWIILLVFLVFSLGFVVRDDVLRYRDLQRRLRAEREEG